MNTFKRKALSAAVAAGLGAMVVAGTAGAVQLSQDGTGSAMIFPYYTVRSNTDGSYNTLISLTNTTDSVKAVKVRFLEGKNSREVLDFNLWLSPNDVWTGTLAPNSSTGGTTLTSGDNSCVTTSGGVTKSVAAGKSFDFAKVLYAQGAADLANEDGVDATAAEMLSLDRTREGYFEVLEMGVVNTATAAQTVATVAYPSGATLAAGVTHTTTGEPLDCSVVPVTAPTGNTTINGLFSTPTGGLMGHASLINVNSGVDFGYDPVALDDVFASAKFFPPNNTYPNFGNTDTEARIFQYIAGSGTVAVTTAGLNAASISELPGWDAVSALLSRDNVMNTYVLDTGLASKTDWVLTFPTKRPYIVPATAGVATNLRPFDAYTQFTDTGSCGNISLAPFDREEQFTVPESVVVEVSPYVPGDAPASNQVCWESTVLNFHPSSTAAPATTATVLGSTNGRSVGVDFTHGWANLSFTDARTNIVDATAAPYQFSGLPVVGFAVQAFNNTNVTIGGLPATSGYGGNFNHKYIRNIYNGTTLPAAPAGYTGAYSTAP